LLIEVYIGEKTHSQYPESDCHHSERVKNRYGWYFAKFVFINYIPEAVKYGKI
jgi:hypothetical protein